MFEDNTLSLILEAGLVVKFVLLLLLSFSIFSWAIIVFKFRFISKMERESEEFKKLFTRNKNQEMLYQIVQGYRQNPLANLFKTAFSDSNLTREELRGELKRVVNLESENIEKNLNFLATTGSTAPFIGLFGTVWGIMDSFRGIGKAGSASLGTVAPGIAEALIATAAGLAAAIPAVMAYNFFLGKVRRQITNMEDFSEEVLELYIRRTDATATREKSGTL